MFSKFGLKSSCRYKVLQVRMTPEHNRASQPEMLIARPKRRT